VLSSLAIGCALLLGSPFSVIGLLQVTIVYAVTFPVNPVIFRLLRIGKMVRAVRMVAVTSFLALQILFEVYEIFVWPNSAGEL